MRRPGRRHRSGRHGRSRRRIEDFAGEGIGGRRGSTDGGCVVAPTDEHPPVGKLDHHRVGTVDERCPGIGYFSGRRIEQLEPSGHSEADLDLEHPSVTEGDRVRWIRQEVDQIGANGLQRRIHGWQRRHDLGRVGCRGGGRR